VDNGHLLTLWNDSGSQHRLYRVHSLSTATLVNF